MKHGSFVASLLDIAALDRADVTQGHGASTDLQLAGEAKGFRQNSIPMTFSIKKSHMDYPVTELQTLVVMKEKQASGA